MIDLFYYKSPNARKIYIALEEMGLPYEAYWVDISAGDQFKPAFLEINPNNKIPAIVDHDGPGGEDVTLFESGAILLYLAEKSGRFLPSDLPRARARYAGFFGRLPIRVRCWARRRTSSVTPGLAALKFLTPSNGSRARRSVATPS